ncbi:MAG: restriction endonuclease subunit M [Rhodospirillaceae bacterium]|nr:restriction endonuclease subunit M [Rhodospirillaceae bacterium]MBT4587964.1 restriction endonuclease subunit M [Rhodospirillaceae bacterium]
MVGSPRPIKSFITTEDDGVNWIKIGDTEKGGRYIYTTKEKIKPSGVSRSRHVKENDFLLSNSMSFGRPYILKTSGCIHDGWLVLSEYQELFSADYLYYLLSSSLVQNQFERLARGSTVRNLNIELVSQVTVPLPPLAEQQRIVAKLDAAFAGIDAAIETVETKKVAVEKLKTSLLSDLLIGDAVMTETLRLGDYYDVRDGTHDSPKYVDEGFPLVTSKNLKDGKIDLSKIKYISEKDYLDINRRSCVDVGDVLMAMIGTIGNPVEIIEPPKFAIKNVALFKTNAEQSPAYLRYFLSHPRTVSRMMSDAKGATQKFVGLGYLRNFPISVPPLAEQKRIVAKLDAIFSELAVANEAIEQSKLNYQVMKSAILAQELQSEAA